MPGPLGLSGKAYEDHVKELARLRKARQRARSRDGHVTGAAQKEARHVTPLDPRRGVQSITPLLPPPLVVHLSERLGAFGRGYRDDVGRRTRLAKLLRDFPHLDGEEEVANALDWLEWPENAERHLSIGLLRTFFTKSEARRVAEQAKAAQPVVPFPAFGTNGHYQQPQTLQRNPNPEAELPMWDDETARRSDAGLEKVRDLMPWRKRTR